VLAQSLCYRLSVFNFRPFKPNVWGRSCQCPLQDSKKPTMPLANLKNNNRRSSSIFWSAVLTTEVNLYINPEWLEVKKEMWPVFSSRGSYETTNRPQWYSGNYFHGHLSPSEPSFFI
jgi:hypothetical protein